MKPNHILFGGSILALIAAILWYLNIIEEPTAAIASTLLTSVAYLFALRQDKASETTSKETSATVFQENKGTGDNIGKNKIEVSKDTTLPNLPKNSPKADKTTIIQRNEGGGDNVGGDKIVIK